MEFIWEASPSLGAKAQMFTHVLHTHYSAPQVNKLLTSNTYISFLIRPHYGFTLMILICNRVSIGKKDLLLYLRIMLDNVL